jgi:small-conductance mechanosensitive channel
LQDPDVPLIGWKSPTHKNLEDYRKAKEFLAEQQAVNMYSGGESAGGPLEKVKEQVETIASLNEQLKTEKENLEQINIADKKGLATQLQVIDALEKRIKNLTTIRQESFSLEKLTVPKGFTEENFNPWEKLWDDYKDFQKIQNKLADAPKFTKPIEDMTDALILQGEAINILTNGFDTLFSSTENGFNNMIDTIIDGLKRLVAEYLAKAAIFTLIRMLFPGSGLAVMATQNLWNMGLGGKATGGLGGFQSQPLNVNVVGSIKGKDIALALRRNG